MSYYLWIRHCWMFLCDFVLFLFSLNYCTIRRSTVLLDLNLCFSFVFDSSNFYYCFSCNLCLLCKWYVDCRYFVSSLSSLYIFYRKICQFSLHLLLCFYSIQIVSIKALFVTYELYLFIVHLNSLIILFFFFFGFYFCLKL